MAASNVELLESFWSSPDYHTFGSSFIRDETEFFAMLRISRMHNVGECDVTQSVNPHLQSMQIHSLNFAFIAQLSHG